MKLIKLGLKNYGIYCGEHNIDFSIEEKGKNVILIGGANGRGKTTILEAIMLALYGKRSIAFNDANMSYSAYLEKYINKTSTDNETAVELVFSLIESKEESTIIKIRRSWEHGRPRTADKVEVWCNSVKDEHLAKYWDVYVEEILPSGITSLFFFDNEKIGRLALEDTGEEVKQSIKALLGINVIDNLVSDLKRIITKKQDEDTAIRDNKEINEKKAELLSIEDSLARLRQAKSQYMQKLAKLQKDLHEKETEFLQKGGRLGESRASLIKDKEVITNELISEKEKLVGISAGAAPLMLVLPILERIRKSAQRDDDIKAAKYANKIISKLKDKFIKQLEGMDIEGKDKFEIIKVFNSELDRIRELESKDQIHNLSPISMSLIDSLISGGFRDIARSTVAYINRIKELQNDLGQIERHLLVEVDEDETNALLKDIKSTSKKIVNLEHEMQQNEEEIARLEKDRTNIENELMGLMKKVMDEQCKQMEVKRIIEYSQKSIQVMEKFKERILARKLEKLGEEITEAFKKVTNKKSLISKVQVDGDTMDILLFDYNNKRLLKSQLSAGEKQMLAVSILWGLAKASGQVMPVIIDTPLGRLDSSHRTNFITEYLPNASNQVILLSTDEEINGEYLELLDRYIGRKYLLDYSDERKATRVVEGYFQGEAS